VIVAIGLIPSMDSDTVQYWLVILSMSMRISELSRASGVPVATIKFYLREHLLPPGRATGATQAQYGEQHLARLRLVRALTEVGRMPLAAVRSVLGIVDAGAEATPAAVGAAHNALPPLLPHPSGSPPRALAVVEELGWHVDPSSESLWQLEAALTALDDVGLPLSPERLGAYGAAALGVAQLDVADVPADDPEEAVRYVVVGTVLYEPVLLALRRLAQQHLYTKAPDR
jgi:DNA-binding transcriptional MerR regulator